MSNINFHFRTVVIATITFVLFCLMPLDSYASTNQITEESNIPETTLEIIEECEEDLDDEFADEVFNILEATNFEVTSATAIEEDVLDVQLNVGEIDSNMLISMDESSVICEVNENGIENEVELTDTGELYLDGEKLEVDVVDSDIPINEDGTPVIGEELNLSRVNYLTSACPYGKKSNYNKYVGQYVSNIKINKYVRAITAGALGLLIGFVAPIFAVGAFAAGILQSYKDIYGKNHYVGTTSVLTFKYRHYKGTKPNGRTNVLQYRNSYHTKKNAYGKCLKENTTYKVWS